MKNRILRNTFGLLVTLLFVSQLTGCGEDSGSRGRLAADEETKEQEAEAEKEQIRDADEEKGVVTSAVSDGTESAETDASADEYMGTWLFPNGASLKLNSDSSWALYDDSENWLFEGDWTTDESTGHFSLYSQVGDAGNNKVADAAPDHDASGYAVLEVKFVPYLTDFTDGEVLLYKAP